MWFRFRRLTVGERGERLAAKFLRRRGYRVLGRNVHCGRYEIDLIARSGDTVVFVEVKTRRAADVVTPDANVGPQKQRHIAWAAEYWIQRNGADGDYYRFDVVNIVLPERGRPTIEVIEDAF